MRVPIAIIAGFASLAFMMEAANSSAETIIMKCVLQGDGVKSEVVYVMNTSLYGEMTVTGEFGTHQAKSFMENGFLYVLEPNAGASVSTMIYLRADSIPYGVRTTFGVIPKDAAPVGAPDPAFLTISMRGYCPIQR